MVDKQKKTILFYVNIDDLSLVNDISFYEQDVRALNELGYDVLISNQYRDFLMLQYDYIYIWWWSYSLLPVVWSRLMHKKIIIAGAFHYSTPLMTGTDFVRRSLLFKLMVKFSLRFANANIFVSNYELSDVTSNLCVNQPQLVHHGIDVDNYQVKQKVLPSGRIQVLMISWLEEHNIKRKCIKESVLAIEELYNKGVEVDFLIAGRHGKGFDDFKLFLESQNCYKNIHVLGHISESKKIRLLQDSDIFLSPTLYEGFGIAIAEALSCGCAVITSDNGAASEVANDAALYADPLSVEDIALKLELLIDKKELRNELSIKARNRIVSNFSYEHHKESLSKVVKLIYK